LLINGRISGLNLTHCIDASHASFKYLAGHRKKSNKNHYPIDDPEIVTGDRLLTPAQEKLANCVVMMAGSGLKSAKRKGLVT
jgi:hypothetical protein